MNKLAGSNAHPHQVRLLRLVENGIKEFEDLDDRSKKILIASGFGIESLVGSKTLKKEKLKLGIKDSEGIADKTILRAKLAVEELKCR